MVGLVAMCVACSDTDTGKDIEETLYDDSSSAALANTDSDSDAVTDSDTPPLCSMQTSWEDDQLNDVQDRYVRADDTSSDIKGNLNNQHLVVRPVTMPTAHPILHLHLGGSGGRPRNCSNISTVAAKAGFRSINLAYMNEDSISAQCANPKTGKPYSDDCAEHVREEVLYGTDASPWVSVARTDSIEYRLIKLLEWLAIHDKDGQWNDFLTADGPAYDHMMVSGFSQGGGMAGMLSRDHSLDRSIFFSKGVDAVGSTLKDIQPAPWHLDTFATPGDRMYGIVHREELAYFYSPVAFAAWGMSAFGDFIDADNVQPPFDCTHQLSTGLTPASATPGTPNEFVQAHASIGVNVHQPTGPDGRPAMASAWHYFFTVDR
ncbi:MAG: BPSS1187 family protein [Myxococcota bacterium]